jgi:hypothetical protein
MEDRVKTTRFQMPVQRTAALWKAGLTGATLLFLAIFPVPLKPAFSICGFRWLTGTPCFFCGLTRSLSCLAHGQWDLAITFHPLGPLAFGTLLAVFLGSVFHIFVPASHQQAHAQRAAPVFWTGCALLFGVVGMLRWFPAD